MEKLTVGSCFSGIGGLELGLEWTGGFETKWQIEMDPYASKVLEKHWPNVKRYSDIRDVVRPAPVDLICGGFPCQDVSMAGKRKGLDGERTTLWGEMFRLICEVKPRWVVAENVPGLLSSDDGQFFGNILRDLAGGGYDAEWQVLSAAACGAPHLRQRIFLIAYPQQIRRGSTEQIISESYGNMGNHIIIDSKASWNGHEINRKTEKTIRPLDYRSVIHRMDDGISSWMDEINRHGNAVVPQVAQKIGEMILKHEASKREEMKP